MSPAPSTSAHGDHRVTTTETGGMYYCNNNTTEKPYGYQYHQLFYDCPNLYILHTLFPVAFPLLRSGPHVPHTPDENESTSVVTTGAVSTAVEKTQQMSGRPIVNTVVVNLY